MNKNYPSTNVFCYYYSGINKVHNNLLNSDLSFVKHFLGKNHWKQYLLLKCVFILMVFLLLL